MTWWNPFKKEVRQLDPTVVAGIPILRLVAKQEPFLGWKDPARIPQALTGILDPCVWAYQLFVYLLLVRQRFGEDIAAATRSQMILILNRDKESALGSHFEACFAIIDRGIAASIRNPTADSEDGKIKIPPELPIALAFLVTLPDSPFFATDPKRVPEFKNEEDTDLAECLVMGKNAALAAFTPIIDKLEVEFSGTR